MQLRLIDALISTLIDKGTAGVKQSVLTNKLQRYGSAGEIKDELERLRQQNKVHRFTVKSGVSRPVTWWRATEEILKDG